MSLMHPAAFVFMRHVAEFNLSFATTAEFEARQAIFAERHDQIALENANPENTFTLGHNKFSTWTNSELDRIRGFRSTGRQPTTLENGIPNADSVDWVTAGCVTPVKDQGSCGSCWSFSTTGSMEGAHCTAGNTLVSLSESQLVDCDTADGNAGCNGGDMYTAMVWTEKNALDTEASYPYVAKDQACTESSHTGVVSCTTPVNITPGSSSALMASIEISPTAIAIEADKMVFQFYTSGVLNSTKCGTNLDHGVLAVGYGTDSAGQAYYLVKNSWNTSWGDQGYIKIANNGDGESSPVGHN